MSSSSSSSAPLRTRNFSIVYASTHDGGIGYNGKLPWNIPNDVQRFKNITSTAFDSDKRNAVIMGRKTWESLPKRPLPDRFNVVITSSAVKPPTIGGAYFTRSFDEALDACCGSDIESVYVIGGSRVIAAAMKHDRCEQIFRTLVLDFFHCDTFVPPIDPNVFEVAESYSTRPVMDCSLSAAYQFLGYKRVSQEKQYLNLIKRLVATGSKKGENISIFGERMVFSLRKEFPRFSTYNIDFDSVLRGSLAIINNNSGGKHAGEWLYYHQWRKFGGEVRNSWDFEEDGDPYDIPCIFCKQRQCVCKGVDQLSRLVNLIKENPASYQLIISSMNPVQISGISPREALAQFYADGKELSCQVYIRAVEINAAFAQCIARYSLILMMIAKATGFRPGSIVFTLGEVYAKAEDVKELTGQSDLIPGPWPSVEITRDTSDINSFVQSDFVLKEAK